MHYQQTHVFHPSRAQCSVPPTHCGTGLENHSRERPTHCLKTRHIQQARLQRECMCQSCCQKERQDTSTNNQHKQSDLPNRAAIVCHIHREPLHNKTCIQSYIDCSMANTSRASSCTTLRITPKIFILMQISSNSSHTREKVFHHLSNTLAINQFSMTCHLHDQQLP